MESQSYAVNEQGERIIAASRRPDGTLRKERRVKPGYVPQDEQPVYQPRGAVVRGQPGRAAVRSRLATLGCSVLTPMCLAGTKGRTKGAGDGRSGCAHSPT